MKSVFEKLVLLYPPSQFALGLFALSFVEVSLFAIRSNQYWSEAEIAWHGRALIVVWSVLSVAAVGWLLYWLGTAARSLTFALPRVFWPVYSLLTLACVAAATLYAASWLYYWRTSMFLDFDALEFALRNLYMMWEYVWQVERGTLLVLGFGLVIGSAVIANAWKRQLDPKNASEAGRCEILRGLLTIGMAINLGLVSAEFYGDPPGGPKQTMFWWQDQPHGRDFELGYRVNPLLTLVVSPVLMPIEELSGSLTNDELGPPRTSLYDIRNYDQRRMFSVIVVAMESLRADMIMLTHQGREIMPNLNELTRTGLWFRRAYAQSTHSNYSDPALFSSLYPLRSKHHHYYSRFDPWPKMLLYDVLKQRGYSTAIFSSQNETWGYMDAFLESANLDVFFDSRSYDGPTLVPEEDIGFARYANGAKVAGKLDDAVTMERAISWLRHQKRDAPFCLCTNLQTAHFPYELPSGQAGPFQPADYDFKVSFVGYPEEKVPIVRNAYFNALRYMDEQLGKLIAYLDESGRRKTTLLVVLGDNGECFYENGHPTHAGPPFQPAVHVALVMNCPGSIESQEENYLTQLIDVVPTIVSWLGLPTHPCFQGIDVLSIERPAARSRAAFIHCCAALSKSDAVVTDSGWKFIHDRKSGEERLYDLTKDPMEQENHVDSKPDIAGEMRNLLQEWRRRQLLYYQTPALYGMFYPPKTPEASSNGLITRPPGRVAVRRD